jgi:hypothetical protein
MKTKRVEGSSKFIPTASTLPLGDTYLENNRILYVYQWDVIKVKP